jgi:hypothetical protein
MDVDDAATRYQARLQRAWIAWFNKVAELAIAKSPPRILSYNMSNVS